VFRRDRSADAALHGLANQRVRAHDRLDSVTCGGRRIGAAQRPGLRRTVDPRLGCVHLRGARAALRDQSALVQLDRPSRPLARIPVREPAALSGRDLRPANPVRVDDDAPGRRRPADRDRNHPLARPRTGARDGSAGRAGMNALRARLARKPPGYQFTIGRVLAIYSGLMVTLLLAALDQTIVATALPKVVSELGGITQYSWVFTAYMLGSTVTVPLYGKLGDIHGRKPLFIVAIV